MTRFLKYTLVLLVGSCSVVGQSQKDFEVASVRPSAPNSAVSVRGIEISGDRVHIGPIVAVNLIALAYGVPNTRIEGPVWLVEPWKATPPPPVLLFEVEAKMPAGTSKDDVPAMLQGLLAERFGLKANVVTKDVEALSLRVGKNGPKLAPAVAGASERTKDEKGRTLIPVGSAKLGISEEGIRVETSKVRGLVDYFSMRLSPMTVMDDTGLTGDYDIKAEIAPAQVRSPSGSLYSAEEMRAQAIRDLQDAVGRLGLELDRRKAPSKIVVVAQMEKSPTVN
jgi:uncharacterized protein (TIGR03435 family)